MLAEDRYIGLPQDVLWASLQMDRNIGVAAKHLSSRPQNWRMRSFAPATATFPSATHAAWFAEQMMRWGHIPADTDVLAIAAEVTDARYYREAAHAIGLRSPTDDFPPMALGRGGTYDPRQSPCATPVAAG
jgi:nitrate/nitrite transport system substrate-binding protein